MDFYTGKPDRPIEHYGIVSYTFYQSPFGEGFIKTLRGLLSKVSNVAQQSDEEALQSIGQLVVSKNVNTNVIYDMQFSTAYAPVSDGSFIITKIYASYGRYKD